MAQQKKSQRHRSGLKAHRQSDRRNLRNRTMKKAIRQSTRACLDGAQSKDAKLPEAVAKAMSLIDKAAQKGAIHWKAAARKKSRLAHRIAKQAAQPAVAAK
ncbi:MAG: 30S ribosomal protein S20 [Elusimicrobia bacterium]|nr:30S ribosomal protein S20 [Elusimicrobiota bacterium]